MVIDYGKDNLNQSKHYNGIDLCKYVMAFAVIAIHTHPLENCTNRKISLIYELLVSMAVPFFFLASGYLLAIKMAYPYQSDNDISRIKNYLIRILKMYLVWTAAYCPLAIHHFFSVGISFAKSVKLYAKGFILLENSIIPGLYGICFQPFML